MGELTILCPRTGKYVHLGISVDRESFKSMRLSNNHVTCPHCGGTHIWGTEDARLLEPLDLGGEN